MFIKRKFYSVVIALLLTVMLVLSACAPSTSIDEESKAKETIEIKLAHSVAVGSHYDSVANKFAELVKDKTDGRVNITIYPAGQLGAERQTVESLQVGTLDMTIVGSAGFAEKKLLIFNSPFLFRDIEHLRAVIHGDIGKEISDSLEANTGVKIFEYFERLPFAISMVEPINSMADWEGKKIRVQEDTMLMAYYRSLGASPEPMAFTEVYTAMRSKLLDGAWTLFDLQYDNKIYEVAKQVIATGAELSPGYLMINTKTWDSLPSDVQVAMQEARQELRTWNENFVAEKVGEYMDKFDAAGVEVVFIEGEEQQKYRDISKNVALDNADLYGGRELYDKIKAAK